MKTVLWKVVSYLGLAVVFLVTVYVCGRLRARFGPGAVLLVASAFTAAWASTPESREMVAKWVRAMERAGISLKELAYRSRMDYAQLSRQLSNAEPMHADRYVFGPYQQRFDLALADEYARPHGGMVVEHPTLVSILQRLEGAA